MRGVKLGVCLVAGGMMSSSGQGVVVKCLQHDSSLLQDNGVNLRR